MEHFASSIKVGGNDSRVNFWIASSPFHLWRRNRKPPFPSLAQESQAPLHPLPQEAHGPLSSSPIRVATFDPLPIHKKRMAPLASRSSWPPSSTRSAPFAAVVHPLPPNETHFTRRTFSSPHINRLLMIRPPPFPLCHMHRNKSEEKWRWCKLRSIEALKHSCIFPWMQLHKKVCILCVLTCVCV